MSETADLVRRAAAGEEPAFAEIVRRHERLVVGTALSLLGDIGAAEDVAQETFVIAHERLADLEDPAALPGFLRTVARRLAWAAWKARRSDVGADEMGAVADTRPTPEDAAARGQQLDIALRALARLPRQQAEVVVLYYLHECSQSQVAGLLRLPETTVNNTLHAARAALKRRMLHVAEKSSPDSLPGDLALRVGRVLSVDGPIVRAQFGARDACHPLDALVPVDENGVEGDPLSVAHREHDGTVTALRVTPTAASIPPGARLRVDLERPARLSDDAVRTLVARAPRADEPPAVVETGIKPVDLFCPLRAGGRIAVIGALGAGRMVLLDELRHRLDATKGSPLTVFSFYAEEERELLRSHRAPGREPLIEEPRGRLRSYSLASGRGGDAGLAEIGDFDAVIVHSLPLGARGLWPSVDPLRSSSTSLRPEIVGATHHAIAERAKQLLRDHDPLLGDAAFLELVANRAFGAARRRARTVIEEADAGTDAGARRLQRRARLLRSFLTTPFFVAEAHNGFPGRHVAIADTIEGCRAILDGEMDDREPDSLMWRGGLTE